MTSYQEDTSRSVNLRPFRGRSIDWDQKVFVYRNVNTGNWSIRAQGGLLGGRVIAHADSLALYGAEFVVSESGRQRVLREGRKNVHAGVVGELAPEFNWIASGDWLDTEIYYNPWQTSTFVVRGSAVPVVRASHVHLGTDGRVRAAGVGRSGRIYAV
jgi:hypothetical protein